jgi:SAM-dependent methyltransferase
VVELIAVHVPKTAGATFQVILSQVYGGKNIYYDYLEASRPRVYQPAEIPSHIKVIHGHFPIVKYDGFFPEAKRIIWLRHPVHLLISLYFYWLHLPIDNPNNCTIVGRIKNYQLGIEEFADQPEIHNILCQNMCGKKLTDFYFVGLQEFFKEDLDELKVMLGWQKYDVLYQNINPNPQYLQDLQKVFDNRDLINRLVKNNNEDLELYQEALRLRAKRKNESILSQPILADWNRSQYQLSQALKQVPEQSNRLTLNVEEVEEKTGGKMNDWKISFVFKGKEFYYNRIRFNNPTERAVEIPIAFDFMANLKKQPASILEVGNVLSFYENSLSETLGIRSRRIVDKFEVEIGVENEDLMNLASDQKYDAIVSLSTVEHIGQNADPSATYGEKIENRDLEAPLKAIAKIYDLLAPEGKALITVPFGKLIDGGWYIQFSKEYLYFLSKNYGIPQEAVSINCLKLIARETTGNSFKVLWEELDALELSYVEYGSPYSQANAIAVIELTKLPGDFDLNLNVEPAPLLYNMPYESRMEFEQNKALLRQVEQELAQTKWQLQQSQNDSQQSQTLLQQSQDEVAQTQLQLQEIQSESEQSQALLYQTQGELEQFQALLYQTQGEVEESHIQLQQMQSESEQSQALLYQTQSELEQSHIQLHQIQSESEQSQALLYQIQGELEQSHAVLEQTQSELEQSQSQLQQTQSELEQSHLQLQQTQSELEQSHLQLQQTQSELEQSHLQLQQTQSELEQSQALLYHTQGELEQSQALLQQTQEKLERFRPQETGNGEMPANSKMDYSLLLWEGWYAYREGDTKRMAHFLKESLKCTPFSPTETVLSWLENFANFASEKGDKFDANRLVDSAEWKELMRRTMNGKAAFAIH